MIRLMLLGARRLPAGSSSGLAVSRPAFNSASGHPAGLTVQFFLPQPRTWTRFAQQPCCAHAIRPIRPPGGPQQPSRRCLRCFSSQSDSDTEVLGTLGGRDIVSAGSVNPEDFFVKTITKDDIEATFSRSQGAGGQNVNKVSTKADIRFDVKHCPWMSDKLKAAVQSREAGRMNKQGELLISSQVTRSQANNLADAIARLQEVLDQAAESIKPIESDPKKVKALEKRKAKAAKKRVEKKRQHSDKKKSRGKVGKGDW